MPDITIVDSSLRDHAGCVTWWTLSGLVDAEDVRGTMEAEGLNPDHSPDEPTKIQALGRAAQAALVYNQSCRQLLRPLRTRGKWEIVDELITQDEETSRDTLRHTPILQLWMDGEDPVFRPRVVGSEMAIALEKAIRKNFEFHKHVLDVTDISAWLTWYLSRKMQAVSLRDRGGFYFVPQGFVPEWRAVGRVLAAVGGHKMHEIPAIHSDQMVESVVHALTVEANIKLKEMETYLAGNVSTRGLNACERDSAEIRIKLDRYSKLLGVSMGGVVDSLDQLNGAVVGARILHEQTKNQATG